MCCPRLLALPRGVGTPPTNAAPLRIARQRAERLFGECLFEGALDMASLCKRWRRFPTLRRLVCTAGEKQQEQIFIKKRRSQMRYEEAFSCAPSRPRHKSTHGCVCASSTRAITQWIRNVLPQPSGHCLEGSLGVDAKMLRLSTNARSVLVGNRFLKCVFRCACLSVLYFPDKVSVGSIGAV